MKFSPLYPDLFVTECGSVLLFGVTELPQTISSAGYPMVRYMRSRKQVQLTVHRLVASVYCDGYAPGLHVNHKNGIKHDNRPENLEWVTKRENDRHAQAVGLMRSGERHGMAKLTDADVVAILARLQAGESAATLGPAYGVSANYIRNLRRGAGRVNQPGVVAPTHYRIGENANSVKLTSAQVQQIRTRLRSGDSGPAIARDYGVSKAAVYAIKHKTSWSHLPDE